MVGTLVLALRFSLFSSDEEQGAVKRALLAGGQISSSSSLSSRSRDDGPAKGDIRFCEGE